MVLGLAEDFSSNVMLDSQLTAIPSSGLFLNSGVHPSITLENLLAFLPSLDFDFAMWDQLKTYQRFETSRNRRDVVEYSGDIYQSTAESNTGNEPEVTSQWMKTNIASLRLKAFIDKVKDRVYADLNLTRQLVNNQYLYEVGRQERTLPNDWCGWVFEAKGSDYVTFRINEVSIQKSGTTPVTLYVLNQGSVVTTFLITPSNGKVSFAPLDYTFSGKGKFYFVIESTSVFSNNGYLDPLKYDGFVCYTCTGIGNDPETATYSYGNTGNGLGFNISVFLDPKKYIDSNQNEFAPYIRSVFEYMAFQVFQANTNNRSNRVQRIQMDDQLLLAELKDMQMDTVVSRYHRERNKAIKTLQRVFDTQLSNNNVMEVYVGSI